MSRPLRTLRAAEPFATEHGALSGEAHMGLRGIPGIAYALVNNPFWAFRSLIRAGSIALLAPPSGALRSRPAREAGKPGPLRREKGRTVRWIYEELAKNQRLFRFESILAEQCRPSSIQLEQVGTANRWPLSHRIL